MVQHFNSLNPQLLHCQEKKKQKEKKMYHTKLTEEILAFLVGFIVLRIFLGNNVRDTTLCHN